MKFNKSLPLAPQRATLVILVFIIGFCASNVISRPTTKLIPSTNLAVETSLTSTNKRSNQRSISESLLTINETPSPGGFWKTKKEWRAYWVKDWVVKKMYVPVWKHVWGPAETREWVPTGVAKPRPTIKHETIIH